MDVVGRRKFLSLIYRSTTSLATWPILSSGLLRTEASADSLPNNRNHNQPVRSCWLDSCVPFVFRDGIIGIINIDDRPVAGAPFLEVFGPKGPLNADHGSDLFSTFTEAGCDATA